MYAIIEDGGKQYKVEPGQTVCVELRDLVEGQETVEFDRVLLVREDEGVTIGTPLVAGAKVVGTLEGVAAGPKLHPAQKRRRKNSKRRIGHRQKYLEVEITAIQK